MHLRYETGVATLVQFIVGTMFSFIGGGVSIFAACNQGPNADCISNAFVSLLLILLGVGYLGALLGLGYVAQERRSSTLAKLLIVAELFTGLVYLFDAKHSTDHLSQITNFTSFLIAAWVVFLAWRLSRAKGGRIVKARPRRRLVKHS